MSGTIGVLADAIDALRDGRYEDVIELLSPLDGSDVVDGLRWSAEGELAARDGRSSDAMAKMEAALATAIAVPDVLRLLFRFFSANGRPFLARHAFLLAEAAAPRSMEDALADLPDAELGRYAPWMLRHSGPARRGELDALAESKRRLIERLGPDGAAVTLAGMLPPSGSGSVAVAPITTLGAYIETHGQGQHRTGDDERGMLSARLEDVTVASRSDVLLPMGAIVRDGITDAAGLLADPVVAGGTPDELLVTRHLDPSRLRRVPEAIWLVGAGTPDPVRWLTTYLPRAWSLADLDGFGEVPLLLDQRLPGWQQATLDRLVGADHPTIAVRPDERVLVERLWVATAPVLERDVADPPGDDGPGVASLREMAKRLRLEPDAPAGGAGVLLVHGADEADADVRERLARRGLAVIRVDRAPFPRQHERIGRAGLVVGIGEAAAASAIFARPDARVIVVGDADGPGARLREALGVRATVVGEPAAVAPLLDAIGPTTGG